MSASSFKFVSVTVAECCNIQGRIFNASGHLCVFANIVGGGLVAQKSFMDDSRS